MSFWGVEVKPGKPYTFSSEEAGGKLFVTQATLGLGSSAQKSVLQCNVGDKSPVLLCSLLPNKNECCSLNLGAFDEDADVKFSVIGPTSIHISGFVEDQAQEDDSESDSYGEDIAETETDGSSDYESDDYEDDFIDDDDMEMFGNSATRKSGVVIEEIEDEEIPATENSVPKTKKKKNLDNDKNSQQQIVVKGDTKAILESEDEDGFPVSAKENLSSEAKKKNKKEIQAKDDNDHIKNLKRKVNSDVNDLEHQRGVPEKGSLPAGIIVEETVKQNKKKKKKNQEAEGKIVASSSDAVTDDRTESKENYSAVTDRAESDEKSENKNVQTVNGDISGEKNKKKKNKKKKKNLDGEGVSNGGVITDSAEKKLSSAEDGTKKSKAKTSHVRTFSNGLIIEELEMGKPDGRRASAGNKVGVHYVGKLKNGKIFDSNIGRAPFKFRLGIGQVIKGWDVGVEGMRIGDKRKLTVPPSMAYGERGCPPQIPPNSWLVFEVTLVNVS